MTFSYYCKISRNFVDSSNWPLAGEQRWLLTSVSLFEVGPRVSVASCGDTGEWRVAAAGPGADLEPCSGDCSVVLGAAGCCRLLQLHTALCYVRPRHMDLGHSSHSATSTTVHHTPGELYGRKTITGGVQRNYS